MKSQFIYIQPKSTDSKLMFDIDLKQLHSCKVIENLPNKLLVKSIAGDYYFWISKESDDNWDIIK